MKAQAKQGVLTLALIIAGLSFDGGAASALWSDAELANRVFVTEDRLEDLPGCDAISVLDAATGSALHRGKTRPSPGRVAVHPDADLALATQVNSLRILPPSELTSDPFLHLAIQDERDRSRWHHGELIGANFSLFGGILVLPDDRGFVVATSRLVPARLQNRVRNARPFKVERFPLPIAGRAVARVGRRIASFETDGTAVEILHAPDFMRLHVLTELGTVHTLDAESLEEVEERISLPPLVARENRVHIRPLQLMHASVSGDGRYLVANRGEVREISVADLEERRAWTLPLPQDVAFVGGVALNRAWINAGLLAVHTKDSVRVLEMRPEGPLVERGRIAIDPPRYQDLGQGELDYVGPQNAIAWTGDGASLIAATDKDSAEFAVLSVEDEGRAVTVERLLSACSLAGFNIPNDIATTNGLLTPPASASPTTRATPSPSATAVAATRAPTASATFVSPTSTDPPTLTARPSPTPTQGLRDLYLPLVLRERCAPKLRSIDAVLVLDASSSMAELTQAGRPKIEAAIEAVGLFLDQVRLAEGDRAAIVSFNAEAIIHASLTADRARLERALASVSIGERTRLDLGIQAGIDLLQEAEREEGSPAVIVLTDGRTSPGTEPAVLELADTATRAGITVIAIGLGVAVDEDLMQRLASREQDYHHAEDAEGLASIYASLSITIPCPKHHFWSRR